MAEAIDYYLASKRNEALILMDGTTRATDRSATTWMDLENSMLSEYSQSHKKMLIV